MNKKIRNTLAVLKSKNLLEGNFVIDDALIEEYRLSYGKGNLNRKNEVELANRLSALNLLKYKRESFSAKDISEGFVYVISNPAWNCVKVGKTIDSKQRLAQMQTYSPYRDYKIEHYAFSQNALGLEKFIHSKLRQFHVNGEWFQIEPLSVIRCIKRFNGSVV
jgi:hypothetical protein